MGIVLACLGIGAAAVKFGCTSRTGVADQTGGPLSPGLQRGGCVMADARSERPDTVRKIHDALGVRLFTPPPAGFDPLKADARVQRR
jgi:hypothetical protein